MLEKQEADAVSQSLTMNVNLLIYNSLHLQVTMCDIVEMQLEANSPLIWWCTDHCNY